MNLARIGHVARGVNAGIQDFQQMQANELGLQERKQRLSLGDADAQWQQQARGRQQQQWKREDDTRALDEEAQSAGMKAIEEDRLSYDNAPAPLGLDGKPGEKSPYTPSKKAILRAAQAQQDVYFRKGRADMGIAMDAKLEPLRASIKGEAANGVMNAMRTGRDITPALREFDALNNDGFDIDGTVETVKQPDGTTAYKVKRKNRFTGKTQEQVVSQRQLVEAMASNIGKPEDAAKFNQQLLLESLKAEGRKDLQEDKDEAALERVKARVSGTITAAQIRKGASGGGGSGDAGLRVQSKTVLADGRIALTMRDGSTKIATDDNGKPLTAIAFEQLVGREADAVGKTLEGGMKPRAAQRQEAAGNLPKPPAGLPKGLPAGSKQIGTSKGKPVYETPDGKRFIAE